MPKKLRRKIFYCLIAAFLVLGTGAVLYAKGWRLSLQPLGVGRVGAIYLHTVPTDVQISLDGKSYKKGSGIFDKGTLLSDLLPGVYNLEVSASGFQPWKMQIGVQSSLVTAVPYVVLVPAQPTLSVATATPIRSIALAGNTLVIGTAAGMETLSGTPIPGDNLLAGSSDGTVILTSASSTRDYLETDLSRATTTDLGRLGGQSFEPVPGDATLFLAKSPAGLNLLRVPGGGILPLATTSVSAVAAGSGRVAWAAFDTKTKTSLISYYDLSSRTLNTAADSLPGQVTQILLQDSNNLFILGGDGSLYSLSLGQSSRVRLDQNVRIIVLADDANALGVLDGQGVRIFFLRGDQANLRINLPDAPAIKGLSWYRDGQHLFVHYPDHVAFLDFADTALKSYVTAAPSGQAIYLPESNILYFLKDAALYQLAFP